MCVLCTWCAPAPAHPRPRTRATHLQPSSKQHHVKQAALQHVKQSSASCNVRVVCARIAPEDAPAHAPVHAGAGALPCLWASLRTTSFCPRARFTFFVVTQFVWVAIESATDDRPGARGLHRLVVTIPCYSTPILISLYQHHALSHSHIVYHHSTPNCRVKVNRRTP